MWMNILIKYFLCKMKQINLIVINNRYIDNVLIYIYQSLIHLHFIYIYTSIYIYIYKGLCYCIFYLTYCLIATQVNDFINFIL